MTNTIRHAQHHPAPRTVHAKPYNVASIPTFIQTPAYRKAVAMHNVAQFVDILLSVALGSILISVLMLLLISL